jgi:hypothetical protein
LANPIRNTPGPSVRIRARGRTAIGLSGAAQRSAVDIPADMVFANSPSSTPLTTSVSESTKPGQLQCSGFQK